MISIVNLRQEVFGYIKKHYNADNKEVRTAFHKYNWNSVRTYANEFRNKNITNLSGAISLKKKIPKSTEKPSTQNKRGGQLSTPSLTSAKLSLMSIKAKLKLLGETAVDTFLLTGTESKILGKAIDLLSKEEFIDQGEIVDGVFWTSDTPPYGRDESCPFLYDHQKVAMKLMDLGHLLWQASRQLAGKTTAALLKDFEEMLENPHHTVALVAPTVPLAVEVLYKFLYTPIKYQGKSYTFYNVIKPYLLKRPNQNGFMLKNDSRLLIISLNQAGSMGRTINAIHITELDKLGSEQSKRIALAGIINSLRANKEARVRIDCNMPTGIFRILKAELFKFGRYFSIYDEDPFDENNYQGRHTIINEDIIVERPPTLDDILKIFSEVLVGFAWAKGQFYNVDDVTGETFNPEKVEIAFNTKYNPKDYYIKTTMGIDPGGKVDAFGVTIWSLTYGGTIVKRWTKRFYNALHTAKEQAKEIAHKVIDYNVEDCQAESSAGSPWSLSLIEHYVNKFSEGKIKFHYIYINFEGEKKPHAKANFVYLFKILLDYERIIISQITDEDRALHHQITNYIVNKAESSNNPDDLVESSFHCIWLLLGGMDYIDKIIHQIKKPIVEVL